MHSEVEGNVIQRGIYHVKNYQTSTAVGPTYCLGRCSHAHCLSLFIPNDIKDCRIACLYANLPPWAIFSLPAI